MPNNMQPTLFKEERDVEVGAHFSPCRRFRFALYRIWNKDIKPVMFVGLNPSKSDETKDDPTIRRVIGMAKEWGYGGVYMTNCFPFISTDPDDLQPEWMVKENRMWLKTIGQKCKDVIFAWGTFDVVTKYNMDASITELFPDALALVINKNGSPRHPLCVPLSVKPVKWVKS